MHNLIPFLSLALLLACQQPCPEVSGNTEPETPKRSRPLAKFEPEHGHVILFAGQELEAVGANDLYSDGYMDHFDAPGGWTTYSNINPGEESFGRVQEGLDGLWDTHDWGDNDYNAMLQHNDPDYANMAMAIGLQFVNHEEKVASGEHDAYIDRLGDFLLELGERPVFLRIAYEFDGDPWNHYDRESTVAAYRRIVDRLRAKGVENTAYVWQSTGFISHPDQLDAWYPGDEYVDWCGVSFFNRWREIEMFEYARKKGKPVFIAEASPTISDFNTKFTGNTIQTQLSDPAQAEEAWQKWFIPFFKAIDENPDVVKAVSYINCHWDSHPMWVNNPTFKGIDARLHLNDSISARWKRITSQEKYLKASDGLYDLLYHR